MSKYIKVDDLQRYCDNQKDHSITPNEFQRMTQYDFGWHTGTPTEEGWYLVAIPVIEKEGPIDYKVKWWGKKFVRWSHEDVVAWQKIEPYEEN